MTLISVKRTRLVWLAVLVVVIGVAGVGYFVSKSNTKSNEPAINQETRVTQPEAKAEVKKEATSAPKAKVAEKEKVEEKPKKTAKKK